MPILQHWDDVGDQILSPAVSKRTIQGASASIVRIALKAGTRADRHSHAFEQFVQVISGAGTLETEDGEQRFSAGSLLHFPPNAWHAAHFEDDTILVETNLIA